MNAVDIRSFNAKYGFYMGFIWGLHGFYMGLLLVSSMKVCHRSLKPGPGGMSWMTFDLAELGEKNPPGIQELGKWVAMNISENRVSMGIPKLEA